MAPNTKPRNIADESVIGPTFVSEYRLQIEYTNEDGVVIEEETLARQDFRFALAATLFHALRENRIDEYALSVGAWQIEPQFVDNARSPAATGFRVHAQLPGGDVQHRDFDIDYFAARAGRVRLGLIRSNRLNEGHLLRYRLKAYLDNGPDQASSPLPILLAQADSLVPIRSAVVGHNQGEPWDSPDDEDIQAVIDRAVIEESVEEAAQNPNLEIGGFLLGHLIRDPALRTIIVLVTGLASGRGTTHSDSTSVTFTPDTFVEARNMIRMRGAQESIVGWYHSHPFRFCAECPLPTPPECVQKVLFYSQDDVHLMERTFYHPFMVGLLAAVEPRIEAAIGHLPVRLYGWRDGVVRERGFHVVESVPDVEIGMSPQTA